jgi:hypothetical protein
VGGTCGMNGGEARARTHTHAHRERERKLNVVNLNYIGEG